MARAVSKKLFTFSIHLNAIVDSLIFFTLPGWIMLTNLQNGHDDKNALLVEQVVHNMRDTAVKQFPRG